MQVLEITPNSRCCKLHATVVGVSAYYSFGLSRGRRSSHQGQGSTRTRVFSLREGTFAHPTASNFLTNDPMHCRKTGHAIPANQDGDFAACRSASDSAGRVAGVRGAAKCGGRHDFILIDGGSGRDGLRFIRVLCLQSCFQAETRTVFLRRAMVHLAGHAVAVGSGRSFAGAALAEAF